MNILIACEYSGRVRDAFKARGHYAVSCDLLPTERAGEHYMGPVEDFLYMVEWDMIIAFPPCTYLCNSGVRWLNTDPSRWAELDKGAEFFNLFLNHPCEKIAIENPIPHKYAVERFTGQQKYTQTIQPWQFGEDASKRTCLWLKGLPKLTPTSIIKKKRYANQTPCGADNTPRTKDRGKIRAQTYWGIANAMANQWG